MSNVIPFNFRSQSVRVIEINAEPWFIAKDVAKTLGYSNTNKAILDHCKSAVSGGVTIRDPMGRAQKPTIIPERDVYRLIMRSRLPTAQEFEEWVVGEVLPSIRKTGSYNANVFDPSKISKLDALKMAVESEEENQRLKLRVAEMQPEVEAFERISKADGSLCVTDAAKSLQMRPKDLFAWLNAHDWIYKRPGCSHWCGKSNKLKQGCLEHKTTTVTRTDGSEKTVEQVRITPKGLTKLAKLLNQEAA